MTTMQKHQLLDRMVSRLAADDSRTATSQQLAATATKVMREVREFNDAMSPISGSLKPIVPKK